MKVTYFIDRPVFSMVISILIVIVGIIGLTLLPIDQYPQITPPVVKISASYPGASALTVSQAVATPIEQELNGTPGMLYMESSSSNSGGFSATITFDISADPDLAAVEIQNRVKLAESRLPAEVIQNGISVEKQAPSQLMTLCLTSDDPKFDEIYLSNFATINVLDVLRRIPGVGRVSNIGSRYYAMQIWVQPDKLANFGLTVQDVQNALKDQNRESAAGVLGQQPIEGLDITIPISTKGRLSTVSQFEEIVLRADADGSLIRLRDVARISLEAQSYNTESGINGGNAAVLGIYMLPGANAMEVAENVKNAMDEISKNFPEGLKYEIPFDMTTYISESIHEVYKTLFEALVLVIFVVFLSLQSWRATLIPVVAVPISLIGTFGFMLIFGFSLNMLTLLGLILAIGIVVDDAIVVVEAVQVNIEKGLSAKQATVEAMHSVSSPIVATTVVLLAVFIPVSFMGSITGLLFQQFSISIAVSVCISSFNALTLSPALCALLLKPRPKVQKGFFAAFNRWFGKRTEEYTSATTRFIGHLKRTGGIVAVTLAAIAVIWHFLPSGFLPDEDQGYVMVFVQTPEASSLQTTVKAMQRVDELVRQRPDVEATSFAAGFNMLAGIASSNSGIIFVKLVDYSQRSKTSSQIASALTEELYVAVPEAVSYAFISPSIPGLGVTSGITLQVQDLEGRGTEFLADETMRFMDSLRKQPQIGSVTTQFNAGIPQRRIEVDKEKALAQGVPLRSFYKTMSTLLGGSYINNFNRFGKLYQTYIQAAPEYRRDKYSLESYFVDDGQGNSIPVSSFTTVRDTTGVEFVSQFNLYRSIELTVNPAAKVSTGQAMDAIEAVAADVLPEAVGTTWSGLSYQEKTASGSSGAVYLLAIVFVFLTLSALYNSWGLPLAILLSVPLAVLGALLFVGAAYLVSPEFINNIYMQISLVMLIGLSAKNAILVVEYADQLFFEKNMDLKAATIEAARLRMRPIMMTAFSFILGVMPLIFASGVYATARNIMGMALVGGMLLATMLGIFIYPALYYLVARVGKFEHKRELKQKES